MKITDKYVFFWGGVFSNFYQPCKITFLNNTFNCSEQFFMWLKAKEFGDNEIAEEILKTTNPKDAKKLGRKVKGFDSEKWDKVKKAYMFFVCSLKFQQNPELLEELLKYRAQTFVEASPFDDIWGIKMSEDDEGIENEENWKGQNLLGKVLTEIRDVYINKGA